MNNLIFVDNSELKSQIENYIPEEYKIITISEIVVKRNNFIKQIIPQQDFQILKEIIEEAESIHIIHTDNFFLLEDLYAWIFENLEVKNFFKVTFDNLEKKNIQNSFNSSIEIEKDEINYIIARNKIDRIISNDVTKIVKWFLLKEDFIDETEASELILTRSFLYALVVLVLNQDKIDNFLAEYYDKVAIDYNYNGLQFRVKSGKKFKADKQEELISLFNILSAKSNTHTIKKFERGTKDIPTIEPLNKHTLQKSCSYIFGYSPKETLAIAKDLFNGIEIEGEKVSLITPINTKSTRIESEKKLQISNFIENNFGKEFFFNGARERKKSDDYETREAIVPNQINDLTTPEKLRKYLTDEQYRVYNYIFWRTISSEMINAEKDATELVVTIEGETLKAESNKLLQQGWLIAGGYWENDIQLPEEEIELPLDLYAGMILNDFRIDTTIYKVLERTPMRYSAGRFFDKASKDLLADEQEATLLIDSLVENKLITLEVKSMIKPTQRAVRLFYTLKEYAPQLVDEAFIAETYQALKNIKDGKLERTVLIDGYYKQLSLLRDTLGYKSSDENYPDEWKIEEAKKIAKQKNQVLTDVVLSNKLLLDNYLKSNEDAVEKLGVCPSCKKGEIFEQEKAYACNNSSCNFIVWKNNINKFYKIFGKDFQESTISEHVKLILSKGYVLVENMFYKEKFFDKKISISFDEKYNNWKFGFEAKKAPLELNEEVEEQTKEGEEKIINEEFISERVEEPKEVEVKEKNDALENNETSMDNVVNNIDISNFNTMVFIEFKDTEEPLKEKKELNLGFLENYHIFRKEEGIYIYYHVGNVIKGNIIKSNFFETFSSNGLTYCNKESLEFNQTWEILTNDRN